MIGAVDRPARVVGSLVYFATEIAEPGVIRHTEGNRISLGEPDGTRPNAAASISEALIKAGFKCPVTARIRTEIWVKILGNVAFNPISALTRATLVQMARDPDVLRAGSEYHGRGGSGREQAGNRAADLHRTADRGRGKSGRAQDVDAAGSGSGPPVGAGSRSWAPFWKLASGLGVPMPYTQAVYACTKLLERTVAGKAH